MSIPILNVHTYGHPRGSLLVVEYDGRQIALTRAEAFELLELLQAKLGEMPVNIEPKKPDDQWIAASDRLKKEWMRRADAAWKDYEQTEGIESRGHRERARAYEAAVRDIEAEIEKHSTKDSTTPVA